MQRQLLSGGEQELVGCTLLQERGRENGRCLFMGMDMVTVMKGEVNWMNMRLGADPLSDLYW